VAKGQVTLEFVFCFLIIILIFYSCVKALQWVGITLVKTHREHTLIHQGTTATQQLNNVSDDVPTMQLMYTGRLMKGLEDD